MSRNEFTKDTRVRAFARAEGRCQTCTAKLFSGNIHYDHIVPDALGGEPSIDNCAVLCKACHNLKTAKRDVPQIAKMRRQRATHIGAEVKRPWFPGFTKKLNGQVVRRGT